MLLTSLPPVGVGVEAGRAALRFGPVDVTSAYSARTLFRSGKPAFELSYWCGTCPFLFERKTGANGTMSSASERLAELEGPASSIEEGVVATFAALLPAGRYLPLLLEMNPALVAPHDERDYFTHEQVATWGTGGFRGLPESPRSFYYRTFETAVTADAHLYEFVVPMVPPAWNDRDRVQHYRDSMARGVVPTSVALSTLDVCQPALDNQSSDYYAHWGLTHFLLDGHHKVEAAARAGATVRLLALVSIDASLATPGDVERLPSLLAQPPRARSPR